MDSCIEFADSCIGFTESCIGFMESRIEFTGFHIMVKIHVLKSGTINNINLIKYLYICYLFILFEQYFKP